MRKTAAGKIALGGILAALAMVIMCLVGIIPVATFVCPALCTFLCSIVYRLCERRVAWAWYGTVSVLAALMGPDKEAAAVFLFLGYYPIIKSWFDKRSFSFVFKLAYFNTVVVCMYALLISALGMQQIAREYMELGYIGLGAFVILGNVSFFLLDKLLQTLGRLR